MDSSSKLNFKTPILEFRLYNLTLAIMLDIQLTREGRASRTALMTLCPECLLGLVVAARSGSGYVFQDFRNSRHVSSMSDNPSVRGKKEREHLTGATGCRSSAAGLRATRTVHLQHAGAERIPLPASKHLHSGAGSLSSFSLL